VNLCSARVLVTVARTGGAQADTTTVSFIFVVRGGCVGGVLATTPVGL
jgi:hypothetical protein